MARPCRGRGCQALPSLPSRGLTSGPLSGPGDAPPAESPGMAGLVDALRAPHRASSPIFAPDLLPVKLIPITTMISLLTEVGCSSLQKFRFPNGCRVIAMGLGVDSFSRISLARPASSSQRHCLPAFSASCSHRTPNPLTANAKRMEPSPACRR